MEESSHVTSVPTTAKNIPIDAIVVPTMMLLRTHTGIESVICPCGQLAGSISVIVSKTLVLCTQARRGAVAPYERSLRIVSVCENKKSRNLADQPKTGCSPRKSAKPFLKAARISEVVSVIVSSSSFAAQRHSE